MERAAKGNGKLPLETRQSGAAQGDSAAAWASLNGRIIACGMCPRLRAHCTKMAAEKRAAYREWTYWGKPVPNMGDADARMLIVGLAPAAHGANRTGRMFTGDRSGEFLFRAMWETGFASQPAGDHAGDGLTLIDAAITATAHCAPPGNKPTLEELGQCWSHLRGTFLAMERLRVVVALGGIAFRACVMMFGELGWMKKGERPAFGHGVIWKGAAADGGGRGRTLIGSYHPSQQNTFTGRLTREMLREVFAAAAREIANGAGGTPDRFEKCGGAAAACKRGSDKK